MRMLFPQCAHGHAVVDPQLRKLLEVVAEAWADAGIDVAALRGSDRVGVYCGSGGSEMMSRWLLNKQEITGEPSGGNTA